MEDYKKAKLEECPFCKGDAKLIFSCHEDNHRHPRDFWFAKIECWSCEATQGYQCVSEQEAKREDIDKDSVLEVIRNWNERK